MTDTVHDSGEPETNNQEPTEPQAEVPRAEDVSSAQPEAEQPNEPGRFHKLKAVGQWYWLRKKWTLPVSVLMLVLLILAIPLTRYLVLGTFLRSEASVAVVDTTTNKPVTGAEITIGDRTAITDSAGKASLRPKVGTHQLTVSKKYYQTTTKTITVAWPGKTVAQLSIMATGRQVPVSVMNKITGKPLANALIKAGGAETRTDKEGKALVVLPTTTATEAATVTLDGYNNSSVTVQVTDQPVAANSFMLTPAGKLYFLSNLSGKIDVVKTDLDGANRHTVLAGTGSEDAYTTSLLASRDWKYLALLAKRSGGSEGLYLINTANDSVTNIDGGSATASFTLIGWSDDTFVYQVSRSNVTNWQSGAQALKSYDASSGKLYSLDQTQGEGTSTYDYGFTNFSTVYLLDNELVYTKNWYTSSYPNHLTGKSDSFISIKPDGSGKRTIKDFPIPDNTQYSYYIGVVLNQPYNVYLQVPNSDGSNSYYQYTKGSLASKNDLTADSFNKQYPTFLLSPSDKQTFWSELRDNKNTLFIGDDNAQNQKQIASLSDYVPYGWYSDTYLLVSKNGSELSIMPADGSKQPIKVTDYYKPQLTYRGYGGGYGGQ